MTFIDQLNNSISLTNIPKKIVSLVPSQSELIWDLGLKDELVGITKFCIHPPDLYQSVTKIGGTKNLNINEIIKLKPDLIIGNKEENDKNQINELSKHFPVWMSDIDHLTDSLTMIEQIGLITDTNAKATEMINGIKNSFTHIKQLNKTVLYLIWNKPYMAAANNTFINDMLQRCGLKNVVTELRYPELDIKTMISLNPEIVFLSSEPYPFSDVHAQELKKHLLNSKTVLVDGELFSWYGSRLLKSADYFNNLNKLIN